jgi:thiol:disulfide interchange protein DsbC
LFVELLFLEVLGMKRWMLVTGLLLALILLLSKNLMAFTKEEATSILKEVVRKELKVLEVKEGPLQSFWEVVAEVGQERMIVYVDKNLRYILLGQILDRQTKKNITLERAKELRKVDVSSLPLENAIPMGEGKRRLYVFTNPECYFCFGLHEELKKMEDIQTFFFLYPMSPTAYEKAKSIWCAPDKVKALEEVYQGLELKSPPCDPRPIDKNIELGRQLLIDSTPTLILQTGKIVEGYSDLETLKKLLDSSSGLKKSD